jgi:palmitoyl-protein thioesterase
MEFVNKVGDLSKSFKNLFYNKEAKEKSLQSNDKVKALTSTKLESSKNKAGNIPTIFFGGMGAKCEQADYVFLVQKFRNELNANTECYPTNLLGSMKIQAEKACEFL